MNLGPGGDPTKNPHEFITRLINHYTPGSIVAICIPPYLTGPLQTPL